MKFRRIKTGDVNLVSKLMEDLKDIAIRCKKVSKQPGVKTFVDYINSKDNFFPYVSVFYNYEEKVFRDKSKTRLNLRILGIQKNF